MDSYLALPTLGSYHSPLLLSTDANHIKRRRRFTFEAFWLQDQECRHIIVESWLSNPRSDPSMSAKLKIISIALTTWSKIKFANGL